MGWRFRIIIPKMSSEKNLRANQVRAIDALLSRMNKTEAAAAVGVNIKTLQRWQDEPLFSETLQRGRSKAVKDASRRLTVAMGSYPTDT